MTEYTQGIVRTHSISLKEKGIALVMLITVFAALLVPVAQAAQNRELEIRLMAINNQIVKIEEQKQMLTAQINQAQLPELTLQKADQKGLSLEKILFDNAKIVVVEE
ncbi:MAG: hypothetical protein WCS59_00335 [Sphaerochaetaceae bacterium]|jgi:cell division protein FtsL|nr:hypothetical protein [Sphaerochaetaceae bacterium]MDD3366029.1 hypothetical protein [Sphaerochaetaceae bacterium]MDD4219493.1 hypothetical protein [Sphaerochaetaceae bacterium]MDY0370948.1 hypothetical protein [Sphaerochaetaceae bacterium]